MSIDLISGKIFSYTIGYKSTHPQNNCKFINLMVLSCRKSSGILAESGCGLSSGISAWNSQDFLGQL